VYYTETAATNTTPYKLCFFVDGVAKFEHAVNNIDAGAYVWLLTVNSSTTLIYFSFYQENKLPVFDKVYWLNDAGNMEICGDIGNMTRSKSKTGNGSRLSNWSRNPVPVSAGGGKFTLKWNSLDSSLGMFYANVPYKYSSTTKLVTKAASTYKVSFGKMAEWKSATGTTRKAFKAYTKPGGAKLSYSVKKGDKLKVLQVKASGGNRYFQVRNSRGKLGWYKNVDNPGTGWYFKNALFAG